MITLFPEGYIRDLLHEQDRKDNPSRHWLFEDSYDRNDLMCSICSKRFDWKNKLEYDAITNRFYKKSKE